MFKSQKVILCKTPGIYYGDSFQFVVLNYKKRLVRKEQEADLRGLNKSMKEAQSKELRMAAKEQLPCYTGEKIINT